MMKKLGVAFCVMSLLGSQTALAALGEPELHFIHGSVLVKKGKKFRLSGSARPGEVIKLGRKSSAMLKFPDGCDVELHAGQRYVVPETSPCAAASVPQQVITPPPPPPPVAVVAAPVESGLGTVGLIGGGLLGAAAIGAGVYFGGKAMSLF